MGYRFLGAQGTVCAGGRYDGLVEQLGGKPTPAVGFAMGIERLVLLLDAAGAVPDSIARQVDAYFVGVGNVKPRLLAVAEELRSQCSDLRILTHSGGGNFANQLKKADRSGARLALIMGEDEAAAGTLTVKYLLENLPQETLPVAAVINRLKS